MHPSSVFLSLLFLATFSTVSAFPLQWFHKKEIEKRQEYPPYTLVAVNGDGSVRTITVSYTTILWGSTTTATRPDYAVATVTETLRETVTELSTTTRTTTRRRYKVWRTKTITRDAIPSETAAISTLTGDPAPTAKGKQNKPRSEKVIAVEIVEEEVEDDDDGNDDDDYDFVDDVSEPTPTRNTPSRVVLLVRRT